jgi:hypothetical protein
MYSLQLYVSKNYYYDKLLSHDISSVFDAFLLHCEIIYIYHFFSPKKVNYYLLLVMTMSSFLFYDPSGIHQQSTLDLDITYIQQPTLNVLRRFISTDNRIQRVLCICCPEKSAAIKAILEYQQVVSIYLCKKHYGPEKNPVYDRRVRDDVELTPTSGWEFKGRLDLLQVCMRYRYNGQVLNELHRLRVIEQRSLSTPQIAIQAME